MAKHSAEFIVRGPDAEEVSKELEEFFARNFEELEIERNPLIEEHETDHKDAVTYIAFVIALIQFFFWAKDRWGNRKKAQKVMDQAKSQIRKKVTKNTKIVIRLPDGTVIDWLNSETSEIFEKIDRLNPSNDDPD